MKHSFGQLKQHGFTIVELLIVIVVIGILVAISFVSFNGVQQSARDKSLASDVESVASELTRYATQHAGVYGSELTWYSGSGSNANIKFTPTSGNVIDVVTTKSEFCIRAFNPASNKKTVADAVTEESSNGACSALFASTAAGGTGVSLVGWWKLNGDTVDASDGGRNGTANNVTPTTDKNGKADGAYAFDGTTSYISLGTDATYDYANFSVSIWAKTTGVPAHVRNLIGMGNWNQANNWFIGFKSGTAATFVYGLANWTVGPSYPFASYDETQWTHYVGTVSPTEQKLYVNGVQAGATVTASHASITNAYPLEVGRSSYISYFFTGNIDDIRLFNQELPPSAISSTYAAGPK